MNIPVALTDGQVNAAAHVVINHHPVAPLLSTRWELGRISLCGPTRRDELFFASLGVATSLFFHSLGTLASGDVAEV